LVAVLALTFAVTGCKKRPGHLTPLPGRTASVRDTGPVDLGPGAGIGMEGPVGGGGVTAGLEEFEGMLADRTTLAANTVYFDYDSAAVKSSEMSNVEAAAAALRSDPNTKLLVEGHCDERGTEEYNRALGERRALSLRGELAKMGIDPMRVRTLSYGEDKPADPGHDESAWRQNRRGEFVLLHPKM
jgi:peptidoglycan-associated lipoprotein